MTDFCSPSGAEALADRLRAFWLERGFEVRARVEVQKAEKSSGATTLFVVRSDIIGGQPSKTIILSSAVGA